MRDQYFAEIENKKLSDLRKTPLVMTHVNVYIFDSILDGLDAYLKRGSLMANHSDVVKEKPGIDLDRSRFIRYLVSAEGLNDRKTGIPQEAEKIFAALNRANEVGKLLSFQTDSPFFLRYTNDETIIHLIEAMLREKIAIPHYFNGKELYNRCLFDEMDWVEYEEMHRNRMELNRLANGYQP